MIALEQINKVFNQGRHNELHAVRDVSLAIEAGRLTCLRGPSGSGKTTLLAMIGCLSRPSSGRITLDGDPLSGLPERFMTEVRRRTFGFVFQQFNLIRGLSLLEPGRGCDQPLASRTRHHCRSERRQRPVYPTGPDRPSAVPLRGRLGDAGFRPDYAGGVVVNQTGR